MENKKSSAHSQEFEPNFAGGIGSIEELADRLSDANEFRDVDFDTQDKVRKIEQEISTEILTDEGAVERVNRSLVKSELYNKLENRESLSQAEREMLIKDLENKGWNKILSNLETGDEVAFFTAPSGDFAIKTMNDVYFGPQITDDILAYRNQALEKLMTDQGHTSLRVDYKTGIFKIDQNEKTDLNKIGNQLDQTMQGYILEKIKQRLIEVKNNENIQVEEKIQIEKDMKELGDKLEKFGFVMSYGTSKVGEGQGEKDKSQIVLAVSYASGKSQTVRREVTDGGRFYGAEYDPGAMDKELQDIYGDGGLAEKISNEHSVVKDSDDRIYKIFDIVDDKYVLNKDLARKIRKNKFIPSTNDDEKAMNRVSEYMRRINVIDLIKPNIAEEIMGQEKLLNGGELADDLVTVKKLINKLSVDDLNEEELRDVMSRLKADAKDSRFTSDAIFHREALNKKDCVYVTLDVMDLGVDLLLSYESAMQDLRNADGVEEKEQIILSAGDDATKKMRDIRGKVGDLYKKYFKEDPTLLVGGDEVTIAMDEQVNVEEFMLELQVETNSRVVKTAVASSERHDDQDVNWQDKSSLDTRVREHLAAQKRSEIGATMAKKIEETKRRVESELLSRGIDREEVGQMIVEAGLANFIIRERYDGGFETVSQGKEKKQSLSARKAVDVLKNLLIELQDVEL